MTQQEKKLKVEEVAVLLDVSAKTINYWYMFKRKNPRDEKAKLLPKYNMVVNNGRKTRLWNYEDIPKLIEFKSQISKGRNGFMGSVTNKKKKGSRIKWQKE